MKSRILIFSIVMTVWVAVSVAQQPAKDAQVEEVIAKTQVADAALVPVASHEPTQVSIAQNKATAIDPDDAYKSNCTRCHLAPRKFSEGKMATIMRHMRVRANLTEEEAKAILGYLTE